MNLDSLLDLTREPMPADDGFTLRVLDDVRSHAPASPGAVLHRWRSRITRPTLLAAAAMIIAGGALAAGGLTDFDPLPTIAPQSQQLAPAPAPATTLQVAPSQAATTAPRPVSSTAPTHATSGYLSSHTAFVIEQGLRLETETFTPRVAADQPFIVRVTLENTTAESIALGERRCLLGIEARRSADGAVSATCAGSDEPTLVIGPHERIVRESSVVLHAGTWSVTAVCQCFTSQSPAAFAQPTTAPVAVGRVALQAPQAPRLRVAGPVPGPARSLTTPPLTLAVQ